MAIKLFIIYRDEVLQYYLKKKGTEALVRSLEDPTPGGLKKECLAACSDSERYTRKDEKALMDFFGKREDQAAYMQAIKKFDREKFKPLSNYLKGETASTEDKNVELLAWLIDFKDRPYDVWKTKSTDIPDSPGLGINVSGGKNTGADNVGQIVGDPMEGAGQPIRFDSSPAKGHARFSIRRTILALLVSLSLGGIFYWAWNSKVGPGDGGCMYWASDHYQQIPCDQKMANTLVIALDDQKLNNFKKITELSSIDNKSIGKVWCVKVNGVYEFYTSDGFHPTELQLRLKPISKYIIDRYVLKKE